jgi:hypothetical protein
VRSIFRSGIVPRNSVPALERIIASTHRWRDSWLPEAICLLLVAVLSLSSSQLHLYGVTSAYDSALVDRVTPVNAWYYFVCLPLFRFLLLRWLWRIGLWWYFLWRVSRLPLRLMPTHPDKRGGIGSLEMVQAHFVPLVMALSVLQCTALAEEFAVGRMVLASVYPTLVVTLLIDAVLVLGPLFFFAGKLWACRLQGLNSYMGLASDYVDAFDAKWVRQRVGDGSGESLLGTPDLQSLADLGTSVDTVREMVWAPWSHRLLMGIVAAGLLPMLPLLLFEYPAYEIARKLLGGMLGL